MKKKLLMPAIALILVTGCVKVEYKTLIKDDSSVTIEGIVAISEGIAEMGETNNRGSMSQEQMKKLKDKGWNVEEYTETKDNQTLVGSKISKTYPNIKDISKKEPKKVMITDLIQDDKEVDESHLFSVNNGEYTANFLFDLADETEESEENDQATNYANMFQLSYEVTLPMKPIKSNATTVSEDGKTLTWKLEYGKVNEINYSFRIKEPSNIAIVFLITAAVVMVAGSTFIVKNKKNKNKD